VRDNLAQDPYSIQAGDPGRDREHGVDRQQLALREHKSWQQTREDPIETDEHEEEKHDIGEKRDRGRIGPKHHALEAHDPEGVERDQRCAKEYSSGCDAPGLRTWAGLLDQWAGTGQ